MEKKIRDQRAGKKGGGLPRLAYRQAEVARMLGVSATFVSQLIAAGRLQAFREGRVVWIAASELDRFINERAA